MSLFQKELANVRNAAYGSALIYSLSKGYDGGQETGRAIPLPVIFVTLPLLLDPEVIRLIRHTRLGLRGVVDKLSNDAKTGSDWLLSLSSRVTASREFTLSCILVLLRTKLAFIDVEGGTLRANDEPIWDKLPSLPLEAKEAEKMGNWLASLSLFEISSVLKVTL